MRAIEFLKLTLKVLLIALLLGIFCKKVNAEEIEKTKGCVFLGWFTLTGDVGMKYFVKITGDMDDYENVDTGEPMIHGYDPLNIRKDKQGRYLPERHKEEWFVEAGKVKGVKGGGRQGVLKCPAY